KFSKQALTEKVAAKGAGAAINPPKPKPAPPLEEADDVNDPGIDPAGDDDAPLEMPPQAAKAVIAKGRKTLAKAAEQLEEVLEKPAPRKSASKRTPGSNSGHNFWLFNGCAPTAGFTSEPIHVEKLLGEAQANAAESTGSGHYRMGQSYGVLETA